MQTQELPAKSPKTKIERREPRRRKVLRLLAYCSVVALVTGGLALRSAYGSVQKSALDMGEELGQLGDVGADRPLSLNGQQIFVGSSMVDLPFGEVLDRVEALCKTDSGSLRRALENMPDAVESKSSNGDKKRAIGIVREDQATRGVVFCFAHDREGHNGGVADAISRFRSFAESGDLQDLGQLRYVYAKTTDSVRTQVISAWTEGSFDIKAFAPKEDGSDTQGTDPRDAPRPPNSVRLLTAGAAGVPYGVRVYRSKASTREVAEAYDAQMPARGWKLTVADGDRRVYSQGSIAMFVTTTEKPEGSLVSLVEMGQKR